MTSSNTSVASTLASIQRMNANFIRSFSSFLFAAGVIGHTLNICVFTRRTLRSNPCARYFLAMAIAGFFVVFGILPLRLLQIVFKIDVFISSNPLCKFLSYLLACIRVLPSWFIVLSCADRFLCSSKSAALRGWSSTRVATRAIPLTILLIVVIYIHMIVKYTVYWPQGTCSPEPGTYYLFLSIWNLVVWSWTPTICMLTFGLLTVRHIRQGKKRIAAQNGQNQSHQNQKKTDRQLIQMMVIQAFVFGSTTTIYSFVHFSVAINPATDSIGKAQQNFLTNTFSYIALTGPCISFYLFTLSSQLFRHELKKLFLRGRLAQLANTVHLTDATRAN